MGRKKKEDSNVLTEMELRLMNIIWILGECTVHEVLEKLEEDYAYNTVSTVVRVLEQKGFVLARKEGRSHFYSAKIKKEDYETIGLENVVKGLFDGEPVSMVRRLIGSGKLSQEDLTELKNLLGKDE